jgi:hypothetical protein
VSRRVHPYRVASPREQLRTQPDRALAWLALVLWAGSVLRAIVGAMQMHHEPMGQEMALALVLVVAIPWLVQKTR